MNLFLALFWLICAAMLLTFEHYVGPARYRIRVGGHDFSWAWMMFLLVLFNLHRWWWIRSYRVKQRAAVTARGDEERERRRLSSDAGNMPDPNFNFDDEPTAPSNRGITDQPPSKN